MKFEMQLDAEGFLNGIKTFQKTMPVAEQWALNNTAFLVRAALQAKIKQVFDRPTNRTVNAPWVQKANHKESELFVLIGMNDNSNKNKKGSVPPSAWLGPEIDGGKRNVKAFESRLHRITASKHITEKEGANKKFWMPTKYMELDGFGNPKKTALVKMLAELQVLEAPDQSGYTANRQTGKKKPRGKTGGFFFHPTKPIVMQRLGNKLAVPVLVATDTAKYRERLPWYETIEHVWNANIEAELQKAIVSAIETSW